VHDEGYDRADEENDEQDLRDPGGTGRDSANPNTAAIKAMIKKTMA